MLFNACVIQQTMFQVKIRHCNPIDTYFKVVHGPYAPTWCHQEQTKGDETMYSNIYQHQSCGMTHTQILPFEGVYSSQDEILFFNTDIKSSNMFSKSISCFRIILRCDHFKWNFYNVFYSFENICFVVNQPQLGDFLFLAFRIGQATGGRGPCTMDKILFKVTT